MYDVNATPFNKVNTQAFYNGHLDNSVQTAGNFVNWPNPDDHWSDIPLDRLDKWKEWGVKENQNDDGGGVNKRRVDPTSYQPQQQNGPPFPQSLGLYQTYAPKSGFTQQQFQTFNSQAPAQDPSHGHRYPFPQYPTSAQNIQLPTQNPYFSPSQEPTKEPKRYQSGFFPSNILVEFPETPILSHPEVKSNSLNYPQYNSQIGVPQYQGNNNVGINGFQDTRFKKHASNYLPYNQNRIQETQFKAKTPEFNPPSIQNFRDPVQIRPFVQFNLKDSVEPYRGQGDLPSTNVNNVQEPFMNYISNEAEGPFMPQQQQALPPHRRQSQGEPLGPQPFNNLDDEMSAPPPPPPNGRFGPRPPRFRMNRPRRRLSGQRRPNNNANFGPPPGPFRRRNNGRQFHGNWTPPEDRFRQQEQTENSVEEDFQPSQNLEPSNEGDTDDDFYEDDFFKDPDFENFDFSDFEEFQVYAEGEGEDKNDSVNENASSEENNLKENEDYSQNENLKNYENEERSETEMGDGQDMDFNYSREALEMFKKRQQQEYQDQNDSFDNRETQKESPSEDTDQSDEKFSPNFVLESDQKPKYSQAPYRPDQEKIHHTQDEFQMSQEILDYEKNVGDRDPFNKFNYDPSPDDDFAEFDKYFDGFDESIENNLDNNFREGRQVFRDQRAELERNPRNEEQLDKLHVITEPFDISDLKYNDEVRVF